MMASLVALDTNVLIYLATSEENTALDRELIVAAQSLVHELKEQGRPMALPTPVVGEFLSHPLYAGERLMATIDDLMQEFVLLPYDTQAAKLYAHIMHHRHQGDVWETYRHREGLPRRCLLADVAILATAEAHRVEVLYTGERNSFIQGMARAAQLNVKVIRITERDYQLPLSATH